MSLALFNQSIAQTKTNPIVQVSQCKTKVFCNGNPVYGGSICVETYDKEKKEWVKKYEKQSAHEISKNFLDKFTSLLLGGSNKRQFSDANPDLYTYDKVYVKTVATKNGSQQTKDSLNRNKTEFDKKGFGSEDTMLRSRGRESKQVLLSLWQCDTLEKIESIEGVIGGRTVRILGTFGEVHTDNDLLGRGLTGVSPKRISLGIVGDVSLNLNYEGTKHNLLINRSGQVFFDNKLIANVEAVPSPKGKWENTTGSNFAQFLNKYSPRLSYGTFTLERCASNPPKESINLYDQECISRYGQKMPMVIDGDRCTIGKNIVAKFVKYGDSVSLRWYLTPQGKKLGQKIASQVKIAIRGVFDTYSNQIENKQSNNISRKLTKLCKDFQKLGDLLGMPNKFTTIAYEKLIALHGVETVKNAIVEDLRDNRNGLVPSRTKGLL